MFGQGDVCDSLVVNSVGWIGDQGMLGREVIASCLAALVLLTPSFAKSHPGPQQSHAQYRQENA